MINERESTRRRVDEFKCKIDCHTCWLVLCVVDYVDMRLFCMMQRAASNNIMQYFWLISQICPNFSPLNFYELILKKNKEFQQKPYENILIIVILPKTKVLRIGHEVVGPFAQK